MITEMCLILLCVLTTWVYYRFSNRHYFKLIENFDNIAPVYPILGHLYLGLGLSLDDKVRLFVKLASQCKKTTKLWFFTKLAVIVNTPQDVQTVLNSSHCLEKGTPYKVLGAGIGLLSAHPTKWKPHRHMLNTAFNLKNALKSTAQVNKISRMLVKDLEPYCNQGEILLLEKIGIRMTENMLYSMLDHSFDKNTLKTSFHIMHKVMNIFGKRMIKFYTSVIYSRVDKMFNIVAEYYTLCSKLIEMLDDAFVAAKLKYMGGIEKDATNISNMGHLRNKPDGFLKRMYRMAYHNHINQEEFEETIVTVLMAGMDTSTRATANIILCLAMNPEIQDKLYTELVEILGDDNEIDYEKVLQVDYLDRVIKESLRFLTLVPLIIRRTNQNITLEHGVVPAGTDIIISIDNIHKSERIWGPDYNKFDPDHFLPENSAKRHTCSFIAFSYGPRDCIGFRYAEITLKLAIANLVRNYKFATHLKPDDLHFDFGMTGILQNDYSISLTKRC